MKPQNMSRCLLRPTITDQEVRRTSIPSSIPLAERARKEGVREEVPTESKLVVVFLIRFPFVGLDSSQLPIGLFF